MGTIKKKDTFLKEVIQLSLPSGIQLMVNKLVEMIDGIMIGQLGEACISAVSISGTFLWLCTTFVMGISNGALILAAQDYGRKEMHRIKKMLSIAITSAVMVFLVFFILMALFPAQILRIYSNFDDVIVLGVEYLSIMKYALLFNLVSLVITTMLRSVRNVKLGFYNSIISCFTNIFFNWVFIFGNLGFPKMGIAGAALGTLFARIIEFMICIYYLLVVEKELCYRLSDFSLHLDKNSLRQLVQVTIPLLLIDILNNLISSAQTMITGRISDSYLSANAIVHNAWILPNVFLWGIGMSASIMIGNAIGAENFDKVKEDSRKFVKVVIILGLCCSVLVQVLIPILSSFYVVSDETLLLAKQMGYAASISVFFIGIDAVICNGILKAGGLTKKILMINIFANWFIALPLGFIGAFVLKLHAAIIYLLLRSGNIVKGFWSIHRLRKNDWIMRI